MDQCNLLDDSAIGNQLSSSFVPEEASLNSSNIFAPVQFLEVFCQARNGDQPILDFGEITLRVLGYEAVPESVGFEDLLELFETRRKLEVPGQEHDHAGNGKGCPDVSLRIVDQTIEQSLRWRWSVSISLELLLLKALPDHLMAGI